MKKKLLSFLVIMCLAVSTYSPALAVLEDIDGTDGEYITVDEMDRRYDRIAELQSQRSILLMEEYAKRETGKSELCSNASNYEQIARINSELMQLGVQQIQPSVSTQSYNTNDIEIPNTPNERWELKEFHVTYENHLYDVYVLSATSKNENSKLFSRGTKVIRSKALGVAAGTADYIRMVLAAASGTVGSYAETIYDLLKLTINNLQKDTIINDVESTYSWQCDTLMHYVFVKLAGTTQTPLHSYTYNEINVLVNGTLSKINFENSGLDKLGFENKEYSLERIMVTRENNLSNAVDCYLHYGFMHSMVQSVTITGVAGEKVAKPSIWIRPEIGFLV